MWSSLMFPELLWNSVRGCWKHWPLLRRSSLTHRRLILRRLCRVFVQILRRLGLSLSPPKVGSSWTDRSWQRRNTHDQLDEGTQPARRDVFNVKHIVNFCNVYVSSSLDSLTLQSGVLGEERQVTVFAVRASRYPTQRRRGGNTTFVFRLC